MLNARVHSIAQSLLMSAVISALICATVLPALANSQARIVRLSDVQGSVQIDKNAGLGFENAFLNLPLTQGTELRTGQNGRAEIELEDGSTLRLTPNTTVEFGTLSLNDEGKRISTVNLLEGRTYVNWLGKTGDQFTLNFSHEKMALGGPEHFRVAAFSDALNVASFKADLQVITPAGAVKVEKKRMVAFNTAQDDQPSPAKKFDEDTYDKWDKEAVSYHEEYARNNTTPLGYGYSDLNYYGSFTNCPGYGIMWQPFFTGAGWNPYMDGAWSFYPGMGYLWASAYPWGWMPYYYGNWAYAPGFGWGWQPGGFTGWHGGVHYVGAALQIPVPKENESTLIVGRGGLLSTSTSTSRALLNNGTAGLGIARGSIGNLRQLSSHAAKTGFVAIQPAPQFAASSVRNSGYSYGPDTASTSSSQPGRAGTAPAGHASSVGAHH